MNKENFGPVVVLYGYNVHDFRWRDAPGRSVYHTTGLVIDIGEKKYVLSVRSRMISCRNIVMYYSSNDSVLRNDLQILFQSIEFDLIILGTESKSELDLSVSELVYGNSNWETVINGYKIVPNFIKPTNRALCQVVRIDLDLAAAEIKYSIHVHYTNFYQASIEHKTFLPINYVYRFSLPSGKKSGLEGICGAPIFNKKFKLIGMVTKVSGTELFVLPTKILYKMMMHFKIFLSKPAEYPGLLGLSLSLVPDQTTVASQLAVNIHNQQKKSKLLKKDDKIMSIDNKPIYFENNMVTITDSDYKENIPMDLYFRLNLEPDVPMNLKAVRNKKKLDYHFFGEPIKNCIFPITDQPSFFPADIIPYVNYRGLIFVQFTHELLHIMMIHNIKINNIVVEKFIKKFFQDGINKLEYIVFIIDCLNPDLSQKFGFPQIKLATDRREEFDSRRTDRREEFDSRRTDRREEFDSRRTDSEQTINVPFVLKINGMDISTLAEINEVLNKLSNDKQKLDEILTLTVGYDNDIMQIII